MTFVKIGSDIYHRKKKARLVWLKICHALNIENQAAKLRIGHFDQSAYLAQPMIFSSNRQVI
jgi:hypothetical protein